MSARTFRPAALMAAALLLFAGPTRAQRTQKPVLHAKHWVAITGKPMAATAGAMMFQKGGNAVDAAAAMLAATSTMWDVLSWGGETQALIYHPGLKKVIALNALGVAPSGATPEFFRKKGWKYPPEYGVHAMVTPGTPGGLRTMMAEWGRLKLADVLAPAIEMAEGGYPVEADAVRRIRANVERMKKWPYTAAVFFPRGGDGPEVGEILVQSDLAATLHKLVDAEAEALAEGRSRKEAIYAAYDRFYRGDIAREYVRGAREQGATVTLDDLAGWKVYIEDPVRTDYKGIEVYKLNSWVQGPVMLQMLNILENFDLKAMGYNSARYIHTLYQTMNLAFADRDFYYGDPYYPPQEPIKGLLSKEYAKARAAEIDWKANDPDAMLCEPRGALRPMGGHKGYALALANELIAGALTGGGTSRPETERHEYTVINNMLSTIIDPNRLAGQEAFETELDAAIDHVKGSPLENPDEPVLIPGDPERYTMQQRLADGIPMPSPAASSAARLIRKPEDRRPTERENSLDELPRVLRVFIAVTLVLMRMGISPSFES